MGVVLRRPRNGSCPTVSFRMEYSPGAQSLEPRAIFHDSAALRWLASKKGRQLALLKKATHFRATDTRAHCGLGLLWVSGFSCASASLLAAEPRTRTGHNAAQAAGSRLAAPKQRRKALAALDLGQGRYGPRREAQCSFWCSV